MRETEKVISSEITSRVVTVDDLLSIYNISLDNWEIEKQIVNTWEVGAKGPDNKIVTTPLFQVKVWLKTKQSTVFNNLREEFINDIKKLSPKIEKISYRQNVNKEPLLLELNIFDLHLGKIAWSEETNHEYNLEIASDIFNRCIEEFIDETSNKNIERIVFPIGNDFFNSDKSYPFNSTTKGTPQEEDARWQKTFRLGRQLLVEAINKLQQIAPVDVIMVPGNHDFERNFYLGDSLEGWFYNNENVTVDNSANPRKYYKYGEVLIGYTHGNEEKVTDLPLIMANEKPNDWALSTFREFHLGHEHRKKEIKFKSTEEYQGVIIRYFNSLSATDSWHHKRGYVGAKRSAEALLWDKTKGLKNNLYFTI
jgi:predicted phosphodiesterase